jgi:radical SAM superfamily enzyme YgiQ (UPF0313 family)
VRETTKRPHTLEAYLKIVRKAHALGFKVVSYQILGLPNESLDSMVQTLAFNTQLPVLLGASPFYRTPDAPIARALELTETDYVRARLTAMAIETDGFCRDDLYTLFVTTRILNFLKGLPLSSSVDVEILLKQRSFTPRTEIGFELLREFAESGRMYFSTRRGLIENKRFRTELFRRVLAQAGTVTCQNGKSIGSLNYLVSVEEGSVRSKDLSHNCRGSFSRIACNHAEDRQ